MKLTLNFSLNFYLAFGNVRRGISARLNEPVSASLKQSKRNQTNFFITITNGFTKAKEIIYAIYARILANQALITRLPSLIELLIFGVSLIK